MKKRTKKTLVNIVLVVLALAMGFGGIGSVFYTFFVYPKLLEQAELDYQAQLDEYVKQLEAEQAASEAAALATLSGEIADFTTETEEVDMSILPTIEPATETDLSVPSLADFDTSLSSQ